MLKFKLFSAALVFCLVLALPLFFSSSIPVSGAEASAGSADDPLVTLSYINKVFKPQIEQLIAEKLKDFNPGANSAPSTPSTPSVTSPPSAPSTGSGPAIQMPAGASVSYVTLELTKGQKLRSKEGSLELILRPGSGAVVISKFQTQGIADLTTGDELLNGKSLPINHMLLIPRNDGRGISVTSVIAYVMVRGDYEIY